MTDLLEWTADAAILGYALLGGVFLAFSDFIMRALRATSGSGGPEAMQAINREVFRYVFMPLFLGMAPVSLALGIGAALWAEAPVPLAAAGAVYLIGVFGVTVVCNVPMNNALAAMAPASAQTAAFWRERYAPRWTFWNTVRALACVAAAAILVFAR